MSIVLTLVQTVLEPIHPQGSGGISPAYADANIANSVNRIGELKRLRLSFTSSANIFFYKFFLNPGLFVNKYAPVPFSGAGTRYYYMQPTGVGFFPASYNALGAAFPNIDKIGSVYMTVSSSTVFTIFIEFFQSYDYEGFMEPNIGNNHDHLLKDKKSSTTELTVSGTSVYSSTNIDIRNYLYVENTSIPTDNATYDMNGMFGYKGGFYNQGTHGVAPYWLNPTFAMSRSSGVVTSFSTAEDTIVSFKVLPPAALAVTHMVATLIRVDKNDNTVDMVTNYELQQVCLDPTVTATTRMKSFTAPAVVVGGYMQCSFAIDKTGIALGQKYRIIIHVYHNNFPVAYEVDAFISDEIEVNADVPYNGGGFNNIIARLRDLYHGYAGNQLTCSIEERIRSTVVLDFKDDYNINTYFQDIFNRLGKVITDESRYLTHIVFTIYDDSSTPGQRHVVDQRVMYKTAPKLFIGRNGFSVAFNPGDITLTADWRNRYESGQLNLQTYDSTTGAAMGQLSNQYWGGRSFRIEFLLNFYYDDYITPFTDEIVIRQEMTVRDYSSCVQIHAQNEPDEDKEFWCPDDIMCLRSEFNPACSGGASMAFYHLVTTIEPDPGSITTIQENEVFTPLILPQQTTPLILSQEDAYSSTLASNAKFCVDVASLLFTDYKITAFAKHD